MVDMNIVNSSCPTGYNLYHLPRTESRGGGVAVLYKKSFKLKKLSLGVSFKSFEFTDCIMNYSSTSVRLVVIYKAPPSKKNKLNVTLFLEEFGSFLEKLVTSTGHDNW